MGKSFVCHVSVRQIANARLEPYFASYCQQSAWLHCCILPATACQQSALGLYQQLIACTLKLSQVPQVVYKWVRLFLWDIFSIGIYACILKTINELIIKILAGVLYSDVYDSTSAKERLFADKKYPSNFVMTSIQIILTWWWQNEVYSWFDLSLFCMKFEINP